MSVYCKPYYEVISNKSLNLSRCSRGTIALEIYVQASSNLSELPFIYTSTLTHFNQDLLRINLLNLLILINNLSPLLINKTI